MSKKTFATNKRLQYLSIETLKSLLIDLSISVPRHIYRLALSEALTVSYQEDLDALTAKDERTLALDEIKNLRRYKAIPTLSVYQLHEMRPQPLQDLAVSRFFTVFWEVLVSYLYDKTNNDAFLDGFFEEALKALKDDVHPAFQDFHLVLQNFLEDEDQYCDGLTETQFRDTLEKLANATEIRAIGNAYGIEVPRTLKKEQFRIIVEHELKAKSAWRDHYSVRLQDGTLKDLQEFAKEHGVAYENYMTKHRMITYLTHRLIEQNHQNKVISKQVSKSSDQGDIIKMLHAELREIKALLKQQHTVPQEDANKEPSEVVSNASKQKYNRLMILDVFAGIVLLFLVFGIFTYVGRDLAFVDNINSFFNRLSYRGYGVMELYHNVIGFIVYGEQ